LAKQKLVNNKQDNQIQNIILRNIHCRERYRRTLYGVHWRCALASRAKPQQLGNFRAKSNFRAYVRLRLHLIGRRNRAYTWGDRRGNRRSDRRGDCLGDAATIAATIAPCTHYTTGDRRRDDRSDSHDDDRL